MKDSQKFHKGDYVRLARRSLVTFSSTGIKDVVFYGEEKTAIIIASYAEKFGGDNIASYTVFIKNQGESSWSEESEITLIDKNRLDLLEKWQKRRDFLIKGKSNLDWIFASKRKINSIDGASLQALANCFGLDLWGSKGEGVDWQNNAMQTFRLAKPFLQNKDKEGWIEFCKTITIKKLNNDCLNEPLLIQGK